jgi:hypothetical protein
MISAFVVFDDWTGSMLSDQVTRLNTKTGASVQYLLPRTTFGTM